MDVQRRGFDFVEDWNDDRDLRKRWPRVIWMSRCGDRSNAGKHEFGSQPWPLDGLTAFMGNIAPPQRALGDLGRKLRHGLSQPAQCDRVRPPSKGVRAAWHEVTIVRLGHPLRDAVPDAQPHEVDPR